MTTRLNHLAMVRVQLKSRMEELYSPIVRDQNNGARVTP